MWIATLKLALRNLLLHKMRSALTLLGTILGVASVISMLSVGEGSKQQALDRIRELGATNVIVRSVKPATDNSSASTSNQGVQNNNGFQVKAYGLTYDDFRVLEQLPTCDVAVPMLVNRHEAHHGRRRLSQVRVVATTPDLPRVKRLDLARGRFLNQEDLDKFANVAVLSEGAATALFGFKEALGQPLFVGNGVYRVIGVLMPQDSGLARAAGSGTDDQNRDIYIPLTSARSRIGVLQRSGPQGSREYERVELSEVTLAVRGTADDDQDRVRPTAAMVRSLLNRTHRQKSDFQVVVPLELMAQAEHEKRIWNLVLGSIASISLLVGGIGIMNIMLATVTERTREIGIRRAIGARRRDIIRQFLLETTVLSTTGGVLGIILGVSIPVAVTYVADMQTMTSLNSIFLAFGISVATGVIFGVYPAYKAAAMSPIEALRQQ
ncbi:ABC transporter permease [Planctomycetaceae bacterium SH139]